MRESKFQKEVIDEIKQRLPGAMVLKNDPTYIQGIPDLTVFYKNKWATLECKDDEKAAERPNQAYYVSKMNAMSFSRKIYPQNREEVLNEMEQSFKS